MLIARALNRVVLVARRAAGHGPETQCRRGGIDWALDLDEGIDLSIYLLGAYEPRILRAYTPLLRPGDTVLDIGANIGAHTLHFARLVGPTGSVHAFEPTDFAFAKLRRNLSLNPACASRVNAQQAFLVAGHGDGPPKTAYASWPVSRATDDVDPMHLGRSMPISGASVITGDDYCTAQGIHRIDLIKIDVDGHEFSVLQGLRHTLARLRPKILIELAPFVFDQVSPRAFEELISFLRVLGYDFFHAGSNRALPADANALRQCLPAGGSMNSVLIPRHE